VGQDLTVGGKSGELDVAVERGIRGQTQQSDIPPEEDTHMSSSQ